MYARIKGVPEEDVALYVQQMIARLGFQEGIADKPCKEYSGGNKRKLCVGIALIGNPPIGKCWWWTGVRFDWRADFGVACVSCGSVFG